MATPVDLLAQVAQDGEAHDHLHQECPWFRHVADGGNAGIEAHCQPVRGPGRPPRLVVKLTPRTPEASTVPQPTVPPGGPGLFHVKGMQLPPYVQHLYKHLVGRYGKHDAYRVAVGVVKKWSQGIHPGGRHKGGKEGRVHADVQAAAARNVGEWEADKARAHKQSASHAGHPVAATAVSLASWAAPGASPVSAPPGLRELPVPTAGPRIPKPPDAVLPTPAEVRALISQVPEQTAGDGSLARTARKFLETAAVKLEKDAPLDALASLRGVEAAIYSAYKAGEDPPVAVFGQVPPAEQSSLHTGMAETADRARAYRAIGTAVTALADRIRRNYFRGGVFNGPTNPPRLSQEADVSATDRLIELAGPRPPSSALERLELAVGAGQHAAGGPRALPSHSTTPKPDAHQQHLDHLHRLHTEHLAHVEHIHRLHVEHMGHLAHVGVTGKTPAIRQAALLEEGEKAPVTRG